MDYDDLWVPRKGGAPSWYDQLPADAQQWMVGVADRIVEKGAEPYWGNVHARFFDLHPDAPPAVADTVKNTVRTLVKARS